VPKRLGFVEEGVLRQSERHRDSFKDIVVYSMLADQWG
jgi:ribosomal-protein-serine acetyltransferase